MADAAALVAEVCALTALCCADSSYSCAELALAAASDALVVAVCAAVVLMINLAGCGKKSQHDVYKEIYTRYNEMLKKEGYDLSFYKGERCIRYTYFIPSVNARANILVHNGEIIGGDICGITIDSIMIPIKK